MLSFELNQPNKLVEWLKAKKIDIDYKSVEAYAQYLEFDEMKPRISSNYDANLYECIEIGIDTLKADKVTMYALKKAVATLKVKAIRVGGYGVFDHAPQYKPTKVWGASGQLTQKGRLVLNVNTSHANIDQLDALGKCNIDTYTIIDRNKNDVYCVYVVDDLKGKAEQFRKDSAKYSNSIDQLMKKEKEAHNAMREAEKKYIDIRDERKRADRLAIELSVLADRVAALAGE